MWANRVFCGYKYSSWWLTFISLYWCLWGWQCWRQVAIELLALDCSTPVSCPRRASCPCPIKRPVLTQAVFWLTPTHRKKTQKEACQREQHVVHRIKSNHILPKQVITQTTSYKIDLVCTYAPVKYSVSNPTYISCILLYYQICMKCQCLMPTYIIKSYHVMPCHTMYHVI